jgi:Arc/MetJ family transcription regulator
MKYMQGKAMRTTLTLDDELVTEVMKATSAKTKTRAVTIALEQFVRRQKIDALRSMLGTLDLDPEPFCRLRELGIAEPKGRYRRRSG